MHITLTEYKLKCPQCGANTFEVLRFRTGTVNNRISLRCVSCQHVFGFTQPVKETE
jgi:uncharacterized Zn finger protein